MKKAGTFDLRQLLLFLIPVGIVAADQYTKAVVRYRIPRGDQIMIIEDFFYLTHLGNPGAAWGLFSGYTYLLIGLSALIMVFITMMFFRIPHLLARISLCIVLGGAMGNYIDRAWFLEVTDFLSFNFWGYSFPVFNVADITITVGTILLIVYILFLHKEESKSHADV